MEIKKKLSVSIFLILTLFFLPLISALTISETHLTTTGNLYDIYVNGSITIDNLTITNTTISIYSLNGTGNFTAINASRITIYNLTSSEPYNDVKYNNGTIIGFENIGDNYTIAMNVGQYFQIGNFYTPTSDSDSSSSGGRSGSGGGNYYINTSKNKDNQTNNSLRTNEDNIKDNKKINEENNIIESKKVNIQDYKMLLYSMIIFVVILIISMVIAIMVSTRRFKRKISNINYYTSQT